jgi:hypothetical protein
MKKIVMEHQGTKLKTIFEDLDIFTIVRSELQYEGVYSDYNVYEIEEEQ